MEAKLKKETDENFKKMRDELERERTEVARLKSLESLRLRKLNE